MENEVVVDLVLDVFFPGLKLAVPAVLQVAVAVVFAPQLLLGRSLVRFLRNPVLHLENDIKLWMALGSIL